MLLHYCTFLKILYYISCASLQLFLSLGKYRFAWTWSTNHLNKIRVVIITLPLLCLLFVQTNKILISIIICLLVIGLVRSCNVSSTRKCLLLVFIKVPYTEKEPKRVEKMNHGRLRFSKINISKSVLVKFGETPLKDTWLVLASISAFTFRLRFPFDYITSTKNSLGLPIARWKDCLDAVSSGGTEPKSLVGGAPGGPPGVEEGERAWSVAAVGRVGIGPPMPGWGWGCWGTIITIMGL